MDDIQYVGSNGIDTKDERDTINYAPNIIPDSKRPAGMGTADTDTQAGITLEEDTSVPYPVTDIYIQVSNTYQFVTNLVNSLKQQLANTSIPVSSAQAQLILNSPVQIDNQDKITEATGIPFAIYDEAILHPDNPTYSLITDAVESYAEDINGNIQLELYPDAKELQLNLEELHYLLGNTLYSRFVDDSQIPDSPVVDDTFYNTMKEQEGKQQQAYQSLQDLHAVNEQIYYGLLTTGYGTDDYFDALSEFEKTKKDYDDFSRRMNQQTDFTSFAQTDSKMTMGTALRINRHVVSDSDIDETEVQTLLQKQYGNTQDYVRACAQLQTATKLQINKQMEDKKKTKDLLKTTGSMDLKKRVHDEVINLTNIRNDVYLDLYGMMNNMVDPSRSPAVELFLNQVSSGMEIVRNNYKTYLQEMYQVHMLDHEVRFDKVNQAGDKQVARDSYWLLDNLQK
jgi:hypothetical protein